jgi:hypothetical protein
MTCVSPAHLMKTPSPIIRLSVRSVDALLDAEGSPLLQPRVHPEVAAAIWSAAQRYPEAAEPRIELLVPEADLGREREVSAALCAHFRQEAEGALWDLKENSRNGRTNLLLGILVVAALVFISEWLSRLGEGRVFTILSESMIIIGWVTLWIPAEALLFAHFPIRRKRQLALALAGARITLRNEER